MGLVGQLRSLVRDLDDADNAAFDLWTWLPSYRAAEKHHGDYACEFRPSNADVMIEASQVLGCLKHGKPEPEPDCPCGEFDGDDDGV